MNPNSSDPMESDTSDNKGLDFDHWTSLISDAETSHPDDIEKLSSVYDSFLSEFPLCHGYWRRYADHKTRLCTIDKAVEVFERALESAMYCVQLWVDYCSFSMSFFEDPSDIRRLFKRGLSFVGRDYGCYALWDKYIEFEYSQQEWSSLARIYLQALRFPNKKLHHYYGSWKKLATLFEEEMNSQSNSTVELQSEAVFNGEARRFYGDAEISLVVKDFLYPASGSGRSKALQKYIYIGKQLYQEACELDEKISTFENNIRRTYFHVKPLSVSQLQNWHLYLDFVEMQGDFDWAVKIYERCLIPCAHYPEIWMRYVDFVEINGGREIANYSLDRATQIFVKRVSVIHLFNARFKEQIGDVLGARAAVFQCDAASDPQFVKNVILKANMEKRTGNFTAASAIFREALEMAAEKKQFHTLPILYVHFSRLTYMMTDSADAARDVLIDGIKHVPHCKLLLEELIKFAMMNGGKQHLSVIDSIVHHAVSPESGVNAKDAEDIMSLYLEFVDLCGTIHEVRKVWSRTVQLFPHSMRPTSPDQKSSSTVFDQHVAFTQFSKVPREKDETSAAMPQQPSKDCTTDSLIVLPLHDAEMLLPKNHTNDCIQDPTNQILDQRMPLNGSQLEQTTLDKLQSSQPENIQETLHLPSLEVPREQSTDNTPESNLSSIVVEVKHVSPEILDKPIENTHSVEVNQVRQEVSEQFRENVPVVEVKHVPEEVSKEGTENIPESKLSSVELGCQVAERNELIESSQEITKESNVHRECDYKSEQDLKPLSLENLSLNSQENTNKDSLPSTSLRGETSQEVCTSNGKKLESTCDSDQVYRQSPRNARSLESAGNEIVNPMPIPVLSQQPVNSYGDWRQGNPSDKVYRDSKFGFRSQLQRKSHQQQHVPPQKYQRTDVGSPMPASQGHPFLVVPAQNQQIQQGSQQAQHHNLYQEASGHANITVPNAQPLPNVQHGNYVSSSQSPLPVQSVGPQLSQSSILGNAQYAMQNSQTYNQMWQYYYYQQQPQFLVQQQMHQPQQQQQLLLQQYQQQQQYYVQMQQQQLPLQQQQQFGLLQQQLPLQQQQYNQPLQLQQQLLQEQHPFYMQHHQQSHQQQSHVQEQQQINPSSIEHHPHHQDQAAGPQNNPDVYGKSAVPSLSPNESAQE